MARNGSGTYGAPAGQPAVAGTTITATAHNDLVNDLATEITDSLSRSGKGGMLAVLKAIDGVLGGPGYSFNDEATSGIFRAGAGDVRLAILGAIVAKWVATGLEVTGTVKSSGGLADDTSHGNRGNGALHSVATGAAAGFMAAADKTKLDGEWTFVSKSGDQTSTSDVFADATGLSFAVAANTAYQFEMVLPMFTGTTTIGIPLQFTGPAAPTAVVFQYDTVATSAAGVASTNAFSSELAATSSPAAQYYVSKVWGVVRNGANAGTVQLQLRVSTNGQTGKILQGAFLKWRQIP